MGIKLLIVLCFSLSSVSYGQAKKATKKAIVKIEKKDQVKAEAAVFNGKKSFYKGVIDRDLPHAASLKEDKKCNTLYYPILNNRIKCVDNLKTKKFTHFYISADRGKQFSFIDKPKQFKKYLKEILGLSKTKVRGLLFPVVWIFSDDSTEFQKLAKTDLPKLKNKLTKFVKKIDIYVTSYVLGESLDKYFDQKTINELGKHLRSITKKQIGTHQSAGGYDLAKNTWVDYIVYDFKSKNVSPTMTEAKLVLKNSKKPFVVGDFPFVKKQEKKLVLATAALMSGASGFSHGGDPKVIRAALKAKK